MTLRGETAAGMLRTPLSRINLPLRILMRDLRQTFERFFLLIYEIPFTCCQCDDLHLGAIHLDKQAINALRENRFLFLLRNVFLKRDNSRDIPLDLTHQCGGLIKELFFLLFSLPRKQISSWSFPIVKWAQNEAKMPNNITSCAKRSEGNWLSDSRTWRFVFTARPTWEIIAVVTTRLTTFAQIQLATHCLLSFLVYICLEANSGQFTNAKRKRRACVSQRNSSRCRIERSGKTSNVKLTWWTGFSIPKSSSCTTHSSTIKWCVLFWSCEFDELPRMWTPRKTLFFFTLAESMAANCSIVYSTTSLF